MEFLLIGSAVAFNIIVIIVKFKRLRILDAILDALILALIMWLSSGSFAALASGTIASAFISLYLLFMNPFRDVMSSLPRNQSCKNTLSSRLASKIDSFLGIK